MNVHFGFPFTHQFRIFLNFVRMSICLHAYVCTMYMRIHRGQKIMLGSRKCGYSFLCVVVEMLGTELESPCKSSKLSLNRRGISPGPRLFLLKLLYVSSKTYCVFGFYRSLWFHSAPLHFHSFLRNWVTVESMTFSAWTTCFRISHVGDLLQLCSVSGYLGMSLCPPHFGWRAWLTNDLLSIFF